MPESPQLTSNPFPIWRLTLSLPKIFCLYIYIPTQNWDMMIAGTINLTLIILVKKIYIPTTDKIQLKGDCIDGSIQNSNR